MPYLNRMIIWLTMFITLMLTTASEVRADPFFFDNVQVALFDSGHALPAIDLFSNQDQVFVAGRFQYIHPLLIGVRVKGPFPDPLTDILRISFTQTGGTPVVLPVVEYEVPCTGCSRDTSAIGYYADLLIGANYPGVTAFRGTVTVDLLGSNPDYVVPAGPNAGRQVDSYTFELNAVRPVPEPATMLLLGSGLAGVFGAVRKRRKL